MPDSEELIGSVLDANGKHRTAMFQAIASEEAVVFVGAGLSAPLGYPTWDALLQLLGQRANALAAFQPASSNPLLLADQIKKHFVDNQGEDEYYSTLGRTYGESHDGCTQTHRRLARLRFRAYVTPNYDPCLERALCDYAGEIGVRVRADYGIPVATGRENRHLVSKFLRSLSEKFNPGGRYVAHIHGSYMGPRDIILTMADYERAYGISLGEGSQGKAPIVTIHRELLWSLLATRRVVFIGCSMDDPYIQVLLDTVCSDLWEWNVGSHFVILPLDIQNAGMASTINDRFGRYGMQPVFFNNLDGRFSNLDKLLEEAIQQWQPPIAPGTVSTSEKAKTAEEVPPATESRQKLGHQWLENINEKTTRELKQNED